MLNKKRFFLQQQLINLPSLICKKNYFIDFDEKKNKIKITILEKSSPSSLQASPPGQNNSNHPSFPSRMPSNV
jgi:hypothetical protein